MDLTVGRGQVERLQSQQVNVRVRSPLRSLLFCRFSLKRRVVSGRKLSVRVSRPAGAASRRAAEASVGPAAEEAEHAGVPCTQVCRARRCAVHAAGFALHTQFPHAVATGQPELLCSGWKLESSHLTQE